jgi:small subunit ribosomal protein S6
MARYEILMLTIPEVTEDEIKGIESQIQGILRAAKGTLISFERWGKYRLCYPVKKNEYGVYFLVRFELPGDAEAVLNDVKSLINVKFYDLIMRSMVTVLDPKQSLVYQRPTSLEEAPRRESGSFLRPSKHAESRASDSVTLDDEVELDDDYDVAERIVAE